MKKSPKSLPMRVKITLTILGSLTFAIIIIAAALMMKWKKADHLTAQMFRQDATAEPLPMSVNTIDDESIPAGAADNNTISGAISFNGKKYKYNDSLVNILLLGTDDKGEYTDREAQQIVPYQTDTIVLGTIDAVKKEFSFLNIPRDTVTTLQVLDFNDEPAATEYGPIATQHSYGSQGVKTNEATVSCVSNLLYGIPIYRYVIVSLEAVPAINSSVGGVTVEVLEDMTAWDSKLKVGKTVTLTDDEAVIYTCRRDVTVDDSAVGRMKRQTQYVTNLFPAAKSKTREDITFPIKLYNSLSDKVDTNLTLDEITYLAKQLLDLNLNADSIETIPGQMREVSADEFEGYNYKMGYVVDEEALKQLIIDRFYTEIETSQK